MEQQGIIQPLIDKPVFNPTYLNIEYIFHKILDFINPIIAFFASSHTWIVIGIISSCLSVFFIAVIIFSVVRMREIQLYEKKELDHEIHEALIRDKDTLRNENPRWHYILTLIESPNESDWRVAIIEADTMLEELLRERGYSGDSVSELLEAARSSGYPSIQNAWDAHLVRNQIAHAGSDFSLTQVEGRRVIKMYQGFFEDLKAI
jgi:hypothetical protein